jgi:NAD-specific glutamate dehydrogenase
LRRVLIFFLCTHYIQSLTVQGTSKAALSFSLDPHRIMGTAGYDKAPYCIFFVVGYCF